MIFDELVILCEWCKWKKLFERSNLFEFLTFFINACQPSLETTGYKKCRSSYRREIRYKYLTFLQQLNVTIILSNPGSKIWGIFLNFLLEIVESWRKLKIAGLKLFGSFLMVSFYNLVNFFSTRSFVKGRRLKSNSL